MFDKNLFAKKLSKIEPYNVDTSFYEVRLDANESFIGATEELTEKFAKILKNTDLNRYPDPRASELCEAFANFYGIKAENVVAGNGSDEIISILMNGFADKGDYVMTFSPDFSMYAFYAANAELECVSLPKTKDSLQIDFDAADYLIKQKKVKFCIFSNPCNPTGRIEKKSDIQELAHKNPSTIFVVDEAYMDFASDLAESESFLGDVTDYPNIIVLKTLSKAIGSASLRVGFVVADKEFCDMFCAVKSPYNLNTVSQKFATAILQDREALKENISKILTSRDYLYEQIIKLGIGSPQKMYTNFIFFETPQATEIFDSLKAKGILIRKFAISGGSLRITAGSMEENEKLICALKETINKF